MAAWVCSSNAIFIPVSITRILHTSKTLVCMLYRSLEAYTIVTLLVILLLYAVVLAAENFSLWISKKGLSYFIS